MDDVIVLSLLAVLDLCFLIFLRWRRSLRKRNERIADSLSVWVRSENGYRQPARRRLLLKLSARQG
jgi:hypothetical protein